VIDVEELIHNIISSLEDAERMAGVPVNHVFVGMSGSHIESFDSRGVIAISGSEITVEDVGRVLEAAQAVSIPANRRILHIVEPGKDGFIRATLRGFVRERKLSNIGDATPFTLTHWSDGTLSLSDSTTGRRVSLEAFGPTNAQAFAQLFSEGAKK
jgi:putative photosynthetic complex assembly protein